MKTLLLLSALICSLNGATIQATLNTLTPMTTTQGTYVGGSHTAIHAGELTFSSPTVGNFQAFCIDPTQTINLGETLTYNVTNTVPIAVAQIWSMWEASGKTGADNVGVQWAIWEITGDTTPDLSAGQVSMANSLFKSNAQGFLDGYNSYSPTGGLVMLTNPNRQDMVAVIPEPGAILLGSIGFIILLRRRR